MIRFKTVSTEAELTQILALQAANSKSALSPAEQAAEGFVTVQHTLELLQLLHQEEPSVIAVDGTTVVGYALVMPVACRNLIPVLEPMFAVLDTIRYNETDLKKLRYYVMGQICIDRAYRGKGIFRGLYEQHRQALSNQYALVVTEIATRNTRSMQAHAAVGFQTIHEYQDATDHWAVVAWDWR